MPRWFVSVLVAGAALMCAPGRAEDLAPEANRVRWTASMRTEFDAAATAMRDLLKARAAGDEVGAQLAERERDLHRARFLDEKHAQERVNQVVRPSVEELSPFKPRIVSNTKLLAEPNAKPPGTQLRASWDLYTTRWGMYRQAAESPRTPASRADSP